MISDLDWKLTVDSLLPAAARWAERENAWLPLALAYKSQVNDRLYNCMTSKK